MSKIFHTNKYLLKKKLHPKQIAFLMADEEEILFGGSCGGGKTYAIFAAALQYVDCKNYHALLLRKTHPELVAPGGLISVAKEWLAEEIKSGEVRWNGDEGKLTFPNMSTITFKMLERDGDVFKYHGGGYSFIGWDELTMFSQVQYDYLFSRCRGLVGSEFPMRIRATSNPGGPGEAWVYEYFMSRSKNNVTDYIDEETGVRFTRRYLPAKLKDNPSLNQEDYLKKLAHLPAVNRKRLLEGIWGAIEPGERFQRQWFENNTVTSAEIPDLVKVCRYWDRGATAKGDWTVGTLIGKDIANFIFILDMVRFRGTSYENRVKIREVAEADGGSITICLEEEPGSGGKDQIDTYSREVLFGFRVDVIHMQGKGSKYDRTEALASYAEKGYVKTLKAKWNSVMFAELEQFKKDPKLYAHDDIVDTLSGGFNRLMDGRAANKQKSMQNFMKNNLPEEEYKEVYPDKIDATE